jgi:hypothetical protein
MISNISKGGCAIAQAVSRWLPTASARVWSSGICGGQRGAGVGFLRVLRFPLPKPFIPPNSLSSQSPGLGTIGQEWPTWRVGPVWTPPPTMQIKKQGKAVPVIGLWKPLEL